MSQYILIDNCGASVVFSDLETALSFMRNTSKYDKKYFGRLYDANEVFNTENFDMDAIREKEPTNDAMHIAR